MRIATRLPMIVVGAAVIAATAVGWFSYYTAAKELRAAAAMELVALRGSRHAAITQYFKSIEEDLELIAESPQIIASLVEFTAVFGDFDQADRGAVETRLRTVFTPEHTHGNRRQLQRAAAPKIAAYANVHNRHHVWNSLALKLKGYYDLFLITPRGDVVYTVFKKTDFASNVLTGTWRDTGLAKVFRRAIDQPDDKRHTFVDFTAYEPSDNAPAAFIARKIVHRGRPIGVLALQMPIDRIDQVMQVTSGMGETGETYLVGPDQLMRSSSRFSKTSTILKQKVTGATAAAALAGKTGVRMVEDYRGVPVLSAYQPFGIYGTRWAVMAEKDMAEILAPVHAMGKTLSIIGLLLTVAIAVGGLLVSLSVTKPLAAIHKAFVRFGETRQVAEIGGLDRGDEIGDMARAFEALASDISSYLEERKESEGKLREAYELMVRNENLLQLAKDTITDGLIVIDADMRFDLVNERYAQLMGVPRDLASEGASVHELVAHLAASGAWGAGDPAELAQKRIDALSNDEEVISETITSENRILETRKAPRDGGGAVALITDITERKKSERIIAEAMALIHESLQYASRIQRSVLPTAAEMADVFEDYFVIWEPKELVGGDIYLVRKCEGQSLLLVADCTGHGVPGAFMTMIATGALDQAIIENPDGNPAVLLNRVNQLVKETLGQHEDADGESDDGFECGLCLVEPATGEMTYAGARFELWRVLNGEIEVIKGDRCGIGYRRTPVDQPFTNHSIAFDANAMYYLFSDGMIDQIGGAKRLSFGKRRLKSSLLDYYRMALNHQEPRLKREFEDYQHNEERRDDITLLGFVPGRTGH